MPAPTVSNPDDFDLSFKVFHELMANKVTEILLVSSPYDAFIMEEDGRLAERIIHEYRGLNLSRPPKLTWVSTAQEALETIRKQSFDLVVTMPRLGDMEPGMLGNEIKKTRPELPVILLAHDSVVSDSNPQWERAKSIDRSYVWCGNTDLMLALIKSVEDRLNVAFDTQKAGVRVIILVEDSPLYCSSLLPLLYKEIVLQTQAVMEESLNDEHRILRMRARPKILVAEDYETAILLYEEFKPFLLSVLSDVHFPRDGQMDPEAGFSLLQRIHKEMPELPLLNLSSEESNRARAEVIPAVFLNKNSPTLHEEIRRFFVNQLGFGDFVFRMPDGSEVGRASNLREMEKILPAIPNDSVFFHASRNDFSSWLMARSEIMLATKLRPIKATDFAGVPEMKQHLVECIRTRRTGRQRGVIAVAAAGGFDPDADFLKIGRGSLGGKARGLAFLATRLRENPDIQDAFPQVTLRVPKTLVISTEGFDTFLQENDLKDFATTQRPDREILQRFLQARFPNPFRESLRQFLETASYPLAVRSSSLLEDAQFQPFAGIYSTYMVPNSHSDPEVRLQRLIQAIQLVYASTYLEAPRAYARSTVHRTEEEKMAVILQELTGRRYGDVFYPAISGVAQSYNFYPVAHMKPEEGIAHIALGLGKIVVEGGTALRFSPRYPSLLPQFSSVENILENAQRFFYALPMETFPENEIPREEDMLLRLDFDDVADHPPVRKLSSTYSPDDHRIRDGAGTGGGYPVLTFSGILKYGNPPLAEVLIRILDMAQRGMGCPVEIEFAMNLPEEDGRNTEFALLQVRPMALRRRNMDVEITEEEVRGAFCYSESAMGNGEIGGMADIVYVKPQDFEPGKTVDIAAEIGQFNAALAKEKRKYVLIGPGRWGSADRWLGIPVTWKDISGVGAMVETQDANLKADPSQGSHFFHNITSLDISYSTVSANGGGFVDWDWLRAQPAAGETNHVRHVALDQPLLLRIDGKTSRAVLLKPEPMSP